MSQGTCEKREAHTHVIFMYQEGLAVHSNLADMKEYIYLAKLYRKLCKVLLLLDGNLENGAHVWSKINILMSLRHLFVYTAV